MWLRYPIIILLFYFLALLQNSFFAHLNLFGAVPNLVLIFFILLILFPGFKRKTAGLEIVIFAIIAGFFSDIFTSLPLGLSILPFLMIAFFARKIQSSLIEGSQMRLLGFSATILISFFIYELAMQAWLFFGPGHFSVNIGIKLVGGIIYNLFFSALIFFPYKKFFGARFEERQLSLFKKDAKIKL